MQSPFLLSGEERAEPGRAGDGLATGLLFASRFGDAFRLRAPGASASRGDVLSVSSRQVLRHPPGGGCWRRRADDRKCPGACAAVRRTELAGRAPFQAACSLSQGMPADGFGAPGSPHVMPGSFSQRPERASKNTGSPRCKHPHGISFLGWRRTSGRPRRAMNAPPGEGGVLSVRSERSGGHPPAGRCCPRGARATMAGWRSLFPSMPSSPPSAGSGWLPVPDLRRVAGTTGSSALPAGSVCCEPSMR